MMFVYVTSSAYTPGLLDGVDPVGAGQDLRAGAASECVDQVLHVLTSTDLLEQLERCGQ
jgi:hypothetical protein